MADVLFLKGTFNRSNGTIPITAMASLGIPLNFTHYGQELTAGIAYWESQGLVLAYQEVDFDHYTVGFLRRGPGSTDPIISLLQGRIGTAVTLVTDAGPVTGTLLLIGVDVAQLREATGNIVLVPIPQINAVI